MSVETIVLLHIFLGKIVYFFFFDSLMNKVKKEQHLLKIEICTITFYPFNILAE